jgi:hypothetical protein
MSLITGPTLRFGKEVTHMSFNIDSNLRLEFGRQRQAELLQRAQRDKLEHALSAEIGNDAGLPAHQPRSFLHLRRNRQALPREAR